jgi:hypothetical protein
MEWFLTPRLTSKPSIWSGLGLNLVVTPIDRLGAQLQTIERGVSRQRFAFIALQIPILAQWIAFADDQATFRLPKSCNNHDCSLQSVIKAASFL